MVIYNTEKTAQEHDRKLRIKRKIYTFGSLGLLAIGMFTFMGLFISKTLEINVQQNYKNKAQEFAKDNIMAFLYTKEILANDGTSVTPARQYFWNSLVNKTQDYWNPIFSETGQSYVFTSVDAGSISVFSFSMTSVDENKDPKTKIPDIHLFVSTQFTISVSSNPTDGTSSISKTMFVSLSYDMQALYTIGNPTASVAPGTKTPLYSISSIFSEFFFDTNPNANNNFPN